MVAALVNHSGVSWDPAMKIWIQHSLQEFLASDCLIHMVDPYFEGIPTDFENDGKIIKEFLATC